MSESGFGASGSSPAQPQNQTRKKMALPPGWGGECPPPPPPHPLKCEVGPKERGVCFKVHRPKHWGRFLEAKEAWGMETVPVIRTRLAKLRARPSVSARKFLKIPKRRSWGGGGICAWYRRGVGAAILIEGSGVGIRYWLFHGAPPRSPQPTDAKFPIGCRHRPTCRRTLFCFQLTRLQSVFSLSVLTCVHHFGPLAALFAFPPSEVGLTYIFLSGFHSNSGSLFRHRDTHSHRSVFEHPLADFGLAFASWHST
jgi:hypothetical protein